MRLNAKRIKQIAADAGFSGCGISSIEILNSHKTFFDNWISSGNNARMNYLSENIDLRKKPELLLEGAKSVISVLLNYYPNENLLNNYFSISKYALGKDYHEVLKAKLQIVLDEMLVDFPELKARIFTDTAPVLERYFAMASGLGFIGKNTCLITPNSGSWVFIGEIICNAEFDYDFPISDNCGSCRRCIDACPVGALSKFGLDANKCISYHTIENKSKTPEEITKKITNQVFGCDICQDVCPHNKNAQSTDCKELTLHSAVKNLNVDELSNISNREFNRRFTGTSLLRAGRLKIIENFSNLKK